MKKSTYIIASLALVLASCSDMQELDEIIVEEGPKAEIFAGIAIEPGMVTKTYIDPIHEVNLNQEYPVLWSDGDEIALISDKISTFTIDSEEKTVDTRTFGPGHTFAKFSGSAASLSGRYPGTKGYPAAYPAEGAYAGVPNNGQFMVGSVLPNKQSFVNGSFADNTYPMAAVSTDGINYTFQNLCGLIQVNIRALAKTERIKAVYLYGNNGEEIAGEIGMWFNSASGEPVESSDAWDNGIKVEKGDETFEKLIFDFGAYPLELSKTDLTTLNFAVIPQRFENGITVEVVDANMGSSFYKTTDITVKRSMIKEITPIINYAAPEPIEIANSYIYEEPGTYLMPAFAMGNRLDVKIDVSKHPNLNADLLWTDIVVPGSGGGATPATKIDAVTDIQYIKMDDGNNLLQFKINTDPATGEAYRGNAAVALYDEDTKEILWSWHLWLTEYHDVVTGGSCADGSYSFSYTVAGETINSTFVGDASSGKLIILDRNLGATEAYPEDCGGDIWKTYGFYYQDGRKDPFIGGHYNGSYSAGTVENYKGEENTSKWRDDETIAFGMVNDGAPGTCRTWWNTELAPRGWNWNKEFINVTQSIQNPLCFSCGCGTGDAGNPQWTNCSDPDNKSWLDDGSGVATKGKQQATGGTHGSTGLSDSGHEAYWNRTKTIMDPCPAGYTVLGERTGVMLGKNDTYSWSTGYGDDPDGIFGVTTTFTYNGTAYSTWWPAAGVRSRKGLMADVGHYGPYFYYDHISATHGGHGMFFELQTAVDKKTGATSVTGSWIKDAVTAKGGIITGHATPIRCVRAKQFSDMTKYPLK